MSGKSCRRQHRPSSAQTASKVPESPGPRSSSSNLPRMADASGIGRIRASVSGRGGCKPWHAASTSASAGRNVMRRAAGMVVDTRRNAAFRDEARQPHAAAAARRPSHFGRRPHGCFRVGSRASEPTLSAPVNTVEPIREKPHGPQTTWGRRLLGPLHVTGIAWYRLHYWLTFFPEWFIVAMNWLSTCFFWFWLWNIRAAVASNLEAVLGPCGFFERQRRIWRTFYDLAWCLTERYEQFRDRPMRFQFEGQATFAQMHESERG